MFNGFAFILGTVAIGALISTAPLSFIMPLVLVVTVINLTIAIIEAIETH